MYFLEGKNSYKISDDQGFVAINLHPSMKYQAGVEYHQAGDGFYAKTLSKIFAYWLCHLVEIKITTFNLRLKPRQTSFPQDQEHDLQKLN